MKTGISGELLNLSGVCFSYEKGKEILKDISFTASEGESIALVGANGIGKSTLMKLLVGLYLNFTGEMTVAGHEMCAENLNHIREHIGYVFQDSDSQLFLSTVEEDVAFGPRNYGLSEDEVEKRVSEALNLVGISNLRKSKTYQLSGGEKKLASIATILSMKPDIIIMDEPSVALDPRNRRNLISVLKGIGGLKIIASHDLDFVMSTCERTILLDDKNIVADGRTQDILGDKALLEAHGL